MTQKFDYIKHYKVDAEEFDYFEERKGATAHDERRVHEFILHKLPSSPGSVLDVGAGSAWVAKYYNGTKTKVVSFDVSKKNVKIAKTNISWNKHYPLVGDSFNLPIKNDTFETVIASEIIEHVTNPEEFIFELFRVVKPGGSLIITTPYKEKLRYYLCIHCNNKTPIHAHIHSFDENKLLSYKPSTAKNAKWETFGNKYLIFLRTFIILKYFTFTLWKLIDKLVNIIKNVPVHILVQYKK